MSAQRPAATPTLLLDDEKVRITRWDFAPGAETGHHVHGMDYVVVPMTNLTLQLEEPGGSRTVTTPAGAAYRRDAGVEHNVINGGDTPMSFIEIEYK
ncbi:cupin domain-containing protein [Nisaea sediminum]|uniref:cupin domain-containing protein n=1 Tax=Nisaea sediminum TaxID=2775867 RepID=UPI0018681987|nr:cupin domain-containing protein [Nisaea sediminum]